MMMMVMIVIMHNMIFEAFEEINFKISVLWDVTPYCLVDGYQRFGAGRFLRHLGTHLPNTRLQIPEDHMLKIRFIFPSSDVSNMF
jgi:hypothetical protein